MSFDNKAVEYYNKYWHGFKPISNYKLRRIIRILNLLKLIKPHFDKLRILDSGCGDGRAVSIWNIIGDAVGIDQSDLAIKNASEQFPFIKYYLGDVVSTEFENETFNVIISQEVIEHIEQQDQYISELSRIISQDGYLILTTPNKSFFDKRNEGNWSNQPVEKLLRIKELKKLLKPYFTIVKLQTVIVAKADHGIYKLLSNGLIKSLLIKIKMYRYYEALLEKANLGVHVVILAKRNILP